MLKWEIKKLCTRFTVISIVILLLLNLATVLLLYGEEGTVVGIKIREARAELMDTYHNDREAYDALYADYRQQNAEYDNWLMYGDGRFTWDNKLIDLGTYGDRQLWRDVLEEINRAESYNTDIEKVLREAYARLRELGDSRGDYTYEYQVNLILHYEELADMQITAQDVLGWNEYFSLVSPVIFLTMAMILLGVQLFLNEKQARFTSILHVCKYGETRTRLAKIGSLFCITVVLTAAFTLLPLAVLGFTTGLSDSGQVMQALSNFEYCHLELTILEYLLLRFAANVLVFFVLGLVTAVLGQLTGSFVLTVGGLLVFLAVNAVLPVGFFTAAFVNFFYERYRAVNFFGLHIPAVLFCLLLIVVITAGAFVLAMFLKINLREYRWIEKFRKLLSRMQNQQGEKKKSAAEHHHTLLGWELSKLVNPRSIALLLVLFAVRCVIQESYFVPALTGDMVVYNNYMVDITELGGTPADAEPYIAEESEYIAKTNAEYDEALLLYREDKIPAEEYYEISSKYHYTEHVSGGFAKLMMKQSYLEYMSSQHENIGYVDEDGVARFLFPDFDVIFVFVILFLFSDLFSSEYQSGFAAIQRLTKYGRKETGRAKYTAAVLTVSAVWMAFTLADLVLLLMRFPMNGLGFGLMSIQDLGDIGWNMPVWAYIVLCRLCGLLGAVLLTVIAVGVSTVTGQNLKSVMILFVILLAPYLLSVFGMTLFDAVNIRHLLYPILPDNLIHYILYASAAVILYAVGARKWNGRHRK